MAANSSTRSLDRPADFAAFLRTETAAAHASLEASLGLLSRRADRQVYVRVLQRFLGFHIPWETAISARDAMGVGGTLTVETSHVTLDKPPERPEEPPPGDYVRLSVSDTGSGMSPEVLSKAFEPFFTTKEVGKGSGLGLAQVYGFAKQSGGGVRIDTRPGEGAVVHVYLPRADGDPWTDAPRALAPAASDRNGDVVLLLDDDDAVREVTSAMLRDLGYAVVEASSGDAALEILRSDRSIDLLVADYAMPGMNGAQVAGAAAEIRPGLPMLFITGYADLAALEHVGEARIIRKPFRDDELARKLAAAALATRAR